ncbi:hypothetical protein [Rhodohalobacter sp.]|uniref:hypothetical protein n=1 Tax=Rhodohalobacter sp. TaxID=1974210 RepID=UPI002ACEEAED|nr:hypothetical protein [Rhodohalobacter sp.]MDZ7756198.1 hypothetical protein [Rhodohalobacter sp.]
MRTAAGVRLQTIVNPDTSRFRLWFKPCNGWNAHLVVGAPARQGGSAYVFENSDSDWEHNRDT